MRARALSALACALACVAAVPTAAAAQKRVVVRSFEGSGAAILRDRVIAALEESGEVELVANDDATAAADSLGADLGSEAGRRDVALRLELSAIVEGDVERQGARRTLTVRVYDGADGSLAGETRMSGKAAPLGKRVERTLWDEIGSAIGRTSVPVEDEPEPEPEPVEAPEAQVAAVEHEEPEPEPEDGARPPALRLRAGLGATTRSFGYNDALPGLRDYCLGPQCDALGLGWLVLAGAHWYPAAHFTDGFVANLGLDLRFGLMFGVDSKTSDGTTFSTSHDALGLGVRLRVPLAEHALGVVIGYGRDAFEIEGEGGADPGVPGVAYGFLRTGVDARFALGPSVSVSPALAYLWLLTYGEIGGEAWFPHTGGGGFEAELAFGLALADWIEIDVAIFSTRFFLSHSPEPTDASVTTFGRVAGGAIDQQLGLRAGLAFTL